MLAASEKILFYLGKSYIPCAAFAVRYIGQGDGQCWIRNSVYFRHQVFLLSDIDLTIYSDSEEEEKELYERYLKLKKVMPIVGEVNIYNGKNIGYIKRHVNYFELNRDPVLKDKIEELSFDDSVMHAHALVYFLRCVQNDYKGKWGQPTLRRRKWGFHINELAKHMKVDQSLTREELFTSLFSLKLQDVLAQKEIYAPHEWLGAGNYYPGPIKELSEKVFTKESLFARDIFRCQIQWEFTGVLSQLKQTNNDKQVKQHLTHLRSLLFHDNTPLGNSLKEDLTSFCSS